MSTASRSYLALVTARAGSKRVPDKNIADLGGRPLLAWSVQAGLDCPEVASVVVSTDSANYQAIALAAGARCPSLRRPASAADNATSASVVHEVLDDLGAEIEAYAGIVLLQPTSPLRTGADISGAIELHRNSGAPAVVSVCEAECPPPWIGQIGPDLSMDDFVPPQYRGLRSQDLGTYHRLNGAIYVIRIEAFRAENGFMPKGTRAYVMPRSRSIDIDTPFDLQLARLLVASDIDK